MIIMGQTTAQRHSGESFQQRLPGKWKDVKNVFKFQISGNAENNMLSLRAVLQGKLQEILSALCS